MNHSTLSPKRITLVFPMWFACILATAWLAGGCGAPMKVNSAAMPSATSSSGDKPTDPAQTDSSESVEESPVNTGSTSGDLADMPTYAGVPVGFTEDGYPFRGDPDAPITFIEYSDYLCPFCGRYFSQTLPTLLDNYALTGQALFVYRDFPLVGLHPTAPVGHVAALCVAEQGAVLFWTMHEELFRTQQQWGALPDPSDFVAALAESVGADMEAYAACVTEGDKQTEVEASVAEASGLGFNGTPSFQFVVNGTGATHDLVGAYPVDEFSKWLDALVLDGEPPEQAQAEETEPTELPFWANTEGLVPDPDRPGYTLAGDQYKGNPEAPLVVVEYADFQCPPCREHALAVQPALDEAFVDSGEILWVFKHLPLKEHAQAPLAAVAAECAAEQGDFWEMHDLIFEHQDKWSDDGAERALPALAKELDLDTETFATCFNGRQALHSVLNDLYDAQGVVQTTPTFIFLTDGRGTLMDGSRPVEQFVTTVQARLDAAKVSLEEGE